MNRQFILLLIAAATLFGPAVSLAEGDAMAGAPQTSSGNNVVPVASGAPASLVTLEEHVQVIRHFLASAGVGSSSLQGDVASMRDLVSNLIAGNSATVARNSVSTTTAPLNDDGDINN